MKSCRMLVWGILCLGAAGAGNAGAAGINLSWNDCGSNGGQSQVFDCSGNSGTPFTVVASFVPPPGLNEFVGLSSELHLFTEHPTLPDWWKMGLGECRSGAMATSFDFANGPFTCTDFYAGQAQGGLAYDTAFGGLDRARIRIEAAVPYDNRGALDPSSEYYAYKLTMQRSKSGGAGACAGCANSACIVLDAIQLYQPPDFSNDPALLNPIGRSYVSWQSPGSGPPGCGGHEAERGVTWGRVKTLYR